MKTRAEHAIESRIATLTDQGVYRGSLESAAQTILLRHRSTETDSSAECTVLRFFDAVGRHHLLKEPDANKDVVGYTLAPLIEEMIGNIHKGQPNGLWHPSTQDVTETAVDAFERSVSRANERHLGRTAMFAAAIAPPQPPVNALR